MNIKPNLFLRATLLILICALTATLSEAQTEEQLDPQETLSINTRLVKVTIAGTDAANRALNDPLALHLYADDLPQKIADSRRDDPATVSLLVDVSDSMKGEAAEQCRYLISEFLKASNPLNHYLLFVFNNTLQFMGEFEGDETGRGLLLEALRQRKYHGATALYTVARETLRHNYFVRDARGRRKAFVIFTDGVDTASLLKSNELSYDLDSFGGFSGIVILGPPYQMGAPSIQPRSYTKQLALAAERALGGESYVARGPYEEIRKVGRRLAGRIEHSIELNFYATGEVAAPGPHTLRVETATGERLSSRRRYVIE